VKQGYFVTGTGTGVGKTFVTAALARRARALGKRVFAFKPIETGVTGMIGEDQQTLVDAAGGWQIGDLAGIYRFSLPAAPSVAADQKISFSRILETLHTGSTGVDLTLVEGAGGWRVPISNDEDMSSLARLCGFPVIVVATASLGTINHSLLTIEAIERDGQSVAGLILSQLPSDSLAHVTSNIDQLRLRWDGPIAAFSTDPAVLDPFI